MDTIFYNGRVHTMQNEETVNAFAVNDGFIVATGTTDEIIKLKDENTELVDLDDKLVVPGFNDSHMHLLNYGISKRIISLSGSTSVKEIAARTKNYLSKNPQAKLIIGRGWNQDLFEKPEFPTKKDLDDMCSDRPLILFRVCGHVAIVNSVALDYFNINETTVIPTGGTVDLEKGVFTETALELIATEAVDSSEIKQLIRDSCQDLLRYGITSVQSDDFGVFEAHKVIAAYQELVKNKQLQVRVYQQCIFDNFRDIDFFLNEDFDLEDNQAFYSHGPIKLLSDGSLGGRTAYLNNPYNDDQSTRGIACFTQQEMDDIVALCHRKKRALAIHCIGDGACYQILESFEKARVKPEEDIRHGIVHCQISDNYIVKKMKELGLVGYIQPIFLDYDIHIVKDRVGETLAKTSYAFKTMLDKGVVVSLGSDCPVEFFNPFHNIYCAVTRQDLKGYPSAGYNPEQALSVQEAVYSYSVGSAFCSYQENIKGKLVPGYYADFAIIDRDIFNCDHNEIKNAEVLKTFVNGVQCYIKA